MALSKTQQALALVKDGMSVREAARQVGVTEPTIYIAIGRNKDKQHCPCCNQIVRAGFEVDPAMVKLDTDVLAMLDLLKGDEVTVLANEAMRNYLSKK
jgi:DNA-binding CsgD family transcriptional regulator